MEFKLMETQYDLIVQENNKIHEIQLLYKAYIRSSVTHSKTIGGLIKEYGETAVKQALGDL